MKIERGLIDRCMANERSAQRELYDCLLPYLTAVAARYVHDRSYLQDVLQESFVDLFRNIEKYDEVRASFKTWVVRITVNRCWKQNNKRKEVDYMGEGLAELPSRIQADVIDQLDDEVLMRFIRRMPEELFLVFNLYVLDGFSHREVAEALQISEDLSRKRLSRARKWLDEHTDPDKRELIWNDDVRIKQN